MNGGLVLRNVFGAIRTTGDSLTVIPFPREAVTATDPQAGIDSVMTMVSAVARKSVILDGTSTTTCRGCMSEHRRQEPIWTSVRGAGVKAVSPAERGRSEATRLDVGEHTRTLLA